MAIAPPVFNYQITQLPNYTIEQRMDYLNLPIGEHSPDVVNVIVEVPFGASNKYEYDKKLGVFRLDRKLYSPVHFPGDYGFIPSTLALDGDPLDVLILGESPTFPGCLVEVRPVGVLNMVDQGKHDEKVLAVARSNPRFAEVDEYSKVYPHQLREIQHFFTIYKDLEGKRTEVAGWRDAAGARAVIQESHERYREGAK